MAGVSETRVINDLLTTTLAAYRETLEDQVFDDYPLLSFMNGKLGREMRNGMSIKRFEPGGESIVEHLMYEMNSTAAAYAGYGTIDTTPQDGMTIARYNWKQYAVTVSISGLDRRNNRGRAQLINLINAKTNQSIMSLRDLMSRHAWGDGTAANSLTGMQAHASTTSTVGGLAPATFTWWQADVTTSAGSFAANGEKKMRTTWNNVSYGNQKPKVIFTDQTTFEDFEASQIDRKRYTSERAMNAGFDNLMYKSAPVIFDRDCPSGEMYFMVDGIWSWVVHPDADFKTSSFVEPENQDATTAKIIWQGNLTQNNRRKVGVIRGFTSP